MFKSYIYFKIHSDFRLSKLYLKIKENDNSYFLLDL